METTVKQRLLLYLGEKGLGQNKFEKIAGISNGYISHLKSSPSSDILMKILNASPDLNREWLMTGVGDMLVRDDNEQAAIGNPIVDDFMGSLGALIGDGNVALTDANIRGRMSIPGLSNKSIVYLPVAGDSMIDRDNPDNSIPDGAMVAVAPTMLQTFRWGEVYALVTPEGVVVKKVMPSDGDHIQCVSFNSEKYPPFNLSQDEVLSAWRVVGVVSIRYK